MKIAKQTALLLLSGFFVSCGQNNATQSPIASENPSADISTIPVLPGVDRSVFSDVNPQAVPISCDSKPNSTGVFYREQSNTSVPANFISGSIHVGQPNISSDQDVATIYTGGDTTVGGALDFGLVADINIPGYWKTFMKLQDVGEIASVTDDAFKSSQGDVTTYERYRIPPNSNASFTLKINNKGEIIGEITSTMSVFLVKKKSGVQIGGATLSNTYKDIKMAFKVLGTGKGWSFSGRNQIFKLMESIALKNQNGELTRSYPLESTDNAWSNIKVGMLDAAGRVVGTAQSWNAVKFAEKDCATPSDLVTITSKPSANVYLRVKSALQTTPSDSISLNGRVGKSASLNLSIKNSGIDKSRLYYNVPEFSFLGQLSGGKSASKSISYPCTQKGSFTKYIDVYYSENETASAIIDLAGFPTKDYDYKPSPNTQYGLKFKLKKIKVTVLCSSLQSFKFPELAINSVINNSVTKKTTLSVVPSDDLSTVQGQFQFNLPTNSGVTAQSIVVSPNFEPSTGNNLVSIPINVTAQCKSSAGTGTVTQADVSDPTGNTETLNVPIVINCLGPKLSEPTPSPLSLSAVVGQTASGTVTFTNVGQKDDLGRQADLVFSASTSNTLKVTPIAGTLFDGRQQSLKVSYPCTSAGTFNETVLISANNSEDVADHNKPTKVEIVCTPKNIVDYETIFAKARITTSSGESTLCEYRDSTRYDTYTYKASAQAEDVWPVAAIYPAQQVIDLSYGCRAEAPSNEEWLSTYKAWVQGEFSAATARLKASNPGVDFSLYNIFIDCGARGAYPPTSDYCLNYLDYAYFIISPK